jgi:hypothetical protein
MSYLFRSGTLQLSSRDVEVKAVHLIGNDLEHLGYLENLLGSAFPSLSSLERSSCILYHPYQRLMIASVLISVSC